MSTTNRAGAFALCLFYVCAAACGSNVDVPDAASGSASGSGSESSSGSSSSSATSSGGGSSGAGGAPSACPPGKDPNCNAYPGMTALAGTCNADGTCTCNENDGFLPTNEGTCLNLDLCAYGFLGSCNGNDTAPVDMGTCSPDGTCTCNEGFVLDETDRCISAVCHGGCSAEGDQRCAGVYLQNCIGPASGCEHHWITTDHCPSNWVCNTDATKCVKPSGACNDDTDCACGCGCVGGACQCSGAVPPSCQVNEDCGPECAGLVCVAGACEKASSHP